MNEKERAAGLPPTASYRYADEVGRRLFVAGQVPHDAERNLVGAADVRLQTRRCLENLFAVVDVHGFSRSDIHRVTVYVVGEQRALLDAWDEVVAGFDGEVPPSTLLGVNLLGYPGQLVEVDAEVARR
jgi:enamine deaminase RidA (YjgF/YER057c/UK114 family)